MRGCDGASRQELQVGDTGMKRKGKVQAARKGSVFVLNTCGSGDWRTFPRWHPEGGQPGVSGQHRGETGQEDTHKFLQENEIQVQNIQIKAHRVVTWGASATPRKEQTGKFPN